MTPDEFFLSIIIMISLMALGCAANSLFVLSGKDHSPSRSDSQLSEELVRCVRCGEFVPFQDAHVYEHWVDDDGLLQEDCVCEECKEESLFE